MGRRTHVRRNPHQSHTIEAGHLFRNPGLRGLHRDHHRRHAGRHAPRRRHRVLLQRYQRHFRPHHALLRHHQHPNRCRRSAIPAERVLPQRTEGVLRRTHVRVPRRRTRLHPHLLPLRLRLRRRHLRAVLPRHLQPLRVLQVLLAALGRLHPRHHRQVHRRRHRHHRPQADSPQNQAPLQPRIPFRPEPLRAHTPVRQLPDQALAPA